VNRELAIDKLTEAFSSGHLAMEEYERRVDLAQGADEATLRALLADVEGDPAASPVNAPSIREEAPVSPGVLDKGSYRVNVGEAPLKGEMAAIFASNGRKGRWLAPRRFDAAAIFGSGSVDLREAAIPAEGMRIQAAAVFGSLGIIVPEGIRVRVTSAAIFGSAGGVDEDFGDAEAPLVEINVAAIFGSCGVQVKPRP